MEPLHEAEPPPGAAGGHRHDPYAALRFRDFRFLLTGTLLTVLGEQMLGVVIGWELYQRTNAALALGMVGLVQVVPVVLLALPAGHIVDRFERKWVAVGAVLLVALCALSLALLSATQGSLVLVYTCLLGIGIARAFQSPAIGTILAGVVPPAHYNNAATWESGIFQASAIAGPALGGLLLALYDRPALVYLLVAGILAFVALLFALLRVRPMQRATEGAPTLTSILAGLRFIFSNKVILASISLDMFAVLLGGATALLPIFARDILVVGASGLGWLRAAPSVGAMIAALVIAHLPPFRRAGRTLLLVVAGFGLVTIVFGLSRSFLLSVLMLAALGALDNVSVVIRSTLLLTRTPDVLRGRVNAVHFVFIGISNELGAFESGIAAEFLGPINAVVYGGIGTIIVVGIVALVWPEVRRLGPLTAEEA